MSERIQSVAMLRLYRRRVDRDLCLRCGKMILSMVSERWDDETNGERASERVEWLGRMWVIE